MSDEEDAAGGRPEQAVDADERSESTGATDDSDTDGSDRDAAGEDATTAASADGAPSSVFREGEGPTAHTTERRSLSPSVQLIWGLGTLVSVVVLTLGVSFLATWLDAVPSWAGAAVGVVLLVVGVAWVHLRYRVWAYEVRTDALYLERGVLTHVRTIAPYVRIQHVDTQRGPMERWLGLSTLVVYTAGTRGADVSIPGLTTAEARDLQERVKELAIRAEGGDAV